MFQEEGQAARIVRVTISGRVQGVGYRAWTQIDLLARHPLRSGDAKHPAA